MIPNRLSWAAEADGWSTPCFSHHIPHLSSLTVFQSHGPSSSLCNVQALCSPVAAGKPAWSRKLTRWLMREKHRKDISSGELRTADTGKRLRRSSSWGTRAEHPQDCILCSPSSKILTLLIPASPHKENPRLWCHHGWKQEH